jgi:divalent metal cation (Fe/Co/Zn/Cd) transporter
MPFWGVGVMLVSALVNTFVSKRLFKVGKETDSVALQADAWHLRTDVYTSVGVTAGLLVIWVAGMISPSLNLRWLDPVVAILVALMIMKAAYDLTRASARDLLDVSLPEGRSDSLHRLPSGGRRPHVGGRGSRAGGRDRYSHQGATAGIPHQYPRGAVRLRM